MYKTADKRSLSRFAEPAPVTEIDLDDAMGGAPMIHDTENASANQNIDAGNIVLPEPGLSASDYTHEGGDTEDVLLDDKYATAAQRLLKILHVSGGAFCSATEAQTREIIDILVQELQIPASIP